MPRSGRAWRVLVVAVVLGYDTYLPAISLTRFVEPGDQASIFELATGIASALYAVFAGLLGYHRPRNWPAAVALPWPFILSGLASVVAMHGTNFEPIALGVLLVPSIATLVGWRSGKAIRYRSVR